MPDAIDTTEYNGITTNALAASLATLLVDMGVTSPDEADRVLDDPAVASTALALAAALVGRLVSAGCR